MVGVFAIQVERAVVVAAFLFYFHPFFDPATIFFHLYKGVVVPYKSQSASVLSVKRTLTSDQEEQATAP